MADQVMAYCVKEKSKKPMKEAELVQMANGKYAYKGTCSSCGTKMQVFVGADKAKEVLARQAAGHTTHHAAAGAGSAQTGGTTHSAAPAQEVKPAPPGTSAHVANPAHLGGSEEGSRASSEGKEPMPHGSTKGAAKHGG